MGEVNTIGASSTLTEKKLEASIVAQTDVSPQTSVEAQKKPLDQNKDSFISQKELEGKVKTVQTAEANPKPISETQQTEIVNSTWKEVAKASNELIPEEQEIKIGKQTVTLGSQETIATTSSDSGKTDIKIHSLTAKQEITELQTGITEETKNIARTKDSAGKAIPEVQARIDKMREEVRENTVPKAEQNQERDVETGSNTSIQKLDTSRAALNERILKLEKATKDDSETFNTEQKARIQREITALQTERNRIDKETKIVQLSNGAMIKYKGSDLVEIGSGDAQTYEQKLSANYKGNVRKVKGDGTLSADTEAEATRSDAYKEFKARYKAQTGKELELKENQRLVMYKRADDVIYQIIESSLDDKNNRTTVISNEIKEAKAKQNGTAKEVEGLSGIKDQGSIEVKKFSFDDTKAGKPDGETGVGSKYTASLGYSLAKEFFVNLGIPGAEVLEDNGNYRIKLKDKDAFKLYLESSRKEDYYDFLKEILDSDKESLNTANPKQDQRIKSAQKNKDGSYEIFVNKKEDIAVMNNNIDENKYLKDIVNVYASEKKKNPKFKLENIKPINITKGEEEESSNTDLDNLSSEKKFNASPEYKAEKDNFRFRIINQYLLSSPSQEDYDKNKARLEKIGNGEALNKADLNWLRSLMNLEPLE
ncbi:MAG: hypothetical protein VKK32_01420 [Candidatus Melainabacteria bacterium]|nr:hypothetical protein [Candidatus Melainabacteria bacterium]